MLQTNTSFQYHAKWKVPVPKCCNWQTKRKTEGSSSQMLQMVSKTEGSSSLMLQLACKMEASSSQMPQIAWKMGTDRNQKQIQEKTKQCPIPTYIKHDKDIYVCVCGNLNFCHLMFMMLWICYNRNRNLSLWALAENSSFRLRSLLKELGQIARKHGTAQTVSWQLEIRCFIIIQFRAASCWNRLKSSCAGDASRGVGELFGISRSKNQKSDRGAKPTAATHPRFSASFAAAWRRKRSASKLRGWLDQIERDTGIMGNVFEFRCLEPNLRSFSKYFTDALFRNLEISRVPLQFPFYREVPGHGTGRISHTTWGGNRCQRQSKRQI